MNDLLKALQKEKSTLEERVYIIKGSLSGIQGYYNAAYTEDELKNTQSRLKECEVAISAIKAHRKNR